MTVQEVANDPDALARLAYEMANMEPDDRRGIGELLIRLMGPAAIEHSDRVAPGRVVIEFASSGMGDRPPPICARIARHQRPQDSVLAVSLAVAHYVAWARRVQLDESMLRRVAMAVALPSESITRAGYEKLSVSQIAEDYVVDEAVVQQRLELHHVDASAERATTPDVIPLDVAREQRNNHKKGDPTHRVVDDVSSAAAAENHKEARATPMKRTDDEKRILKAIRTMPFAPHLRVESLEEAFQARTPISLAHIAEYLEALSAELTSAVLNEKATEAELDELKEDIAGAGRLLRRLQEGQS